MILSRPNTWDDLSANIKTKANTKTKVESQCKGDGTSHIPSNIGQALSLDGPENQSWFASITQTNRNYNNQYDGDDGDDDDNVDSDDDDDDEDQNNVDS